MTTSMETNPKAKSFSKPAYLIFLLAGIYFQVTKDFSQATIFWGLALVFDPFNINTPFGKRPLYQKAWLFIHLIITLALFALMIWAK